VISQRDGRFQKDEIDLTSKQEKPMSVAAAHHVEAIAGLKSTVTKVTPLFVNSPGPLPLERAFQSSGGSFLIFVSGSVRASQVQLMQIGIFLDGEQVQTSQEWTNNPNSHLSLVPVLFTVTDKDKIIPGNHTLALRVLSGNTASDQNDYYNATIVELS
jgi:hypothetical protein